MNGDRNRVGIEVEHGDGSGDKNQGSSGDGSRDGIKKGKGNGK